MPKEFVVVEQDGNITWNAKTEKPESFGLYWQAKKRAEEMARSCPGTSIGIYQRVADCTCEVSAPKTKPRSA